MTLYEINQQMEDVLNRLMSTLDPETGEVDEACVHELEDLKLSRDEKLEAIGCKMKNLEAEAEAIKKEEISLKERRTSIEKNLKSLGQYVTEQLGGEKWSCPRVALSFRRSEQVMTVDDIDILPEEYVTVKTERSADKKKIKEAIKAGVEVRGAWLTEKINLIIK